MAVHTTKCKIAKKEKSDRLYKAILTLETEEECYNFFQDLCTILSIWHFSALHSPHPLVTGCKHFHIPYAHLHNTDSIQPF